MLHGYLPEWGKRRGEGEHSFAQVGVKADPLHLGVGQLPPLIPDRVRDPEATEIVHEPGPAYRHRIGLRHSVAAGGLSCEICDAPRVPDGPGRLQVGEVAYGLQDVLELLIGDQNLECWLSCDHRVPTRRRVEITEEHRRLLAE